MKDNDKINEVKPDELKDVTGGLRGLGYKPIGRACPECYNYTVIDKGSLGFYCDTCKKRVYIDLNA